MSTSARLVVVGVSTASGVTLAAPAVSDEAVVVS